MYVAKLFNTFAIFLYFPKFEIMATKVFTFNNEEKPGTGELSSATLDSATDHGLLPDHFLICSSHSQKLGHTPSSNTNTIYVLYEDSNFTKPWFSFGFWYYRPDYVLWVYIRFHHWYKMGKVTRETFLHWVHICVEVDTIKGVLRASINGGNVTTVTNVEGLTPVPKLHLRLGIVHHSYRGLSHIAQFWGSVTDINILTLETNVNELVISEASVGSSCGSIESSTYLSWSNTKWNVIGEAVEEEEVDREVLFSASKVLNFRIPFFLKKFKATAECFKYGNASISKPPMSAMINFTNVDFENIYGKHFGQCEYFWTPFTDKYIEGTFIDEVDNESIR